VKPSNFVIGRGGNTDRIFIIDFGLARAYKDRLTGEILPPRADIGGFRGTPRYASVYVHREQDLSRRDDLLSLLYILVEFVTGDLPWGSKRDKAVIGRIKERYHSPKLLKGCPSCLLPFFKHVSALSFEERPDYDLLRSLLETKLNKLKVRPDALYDWEVDGRETAAGADDELYAVPTTAAPQGSSAEAAAMNRKPAAQERAGCASCWTGTRAWWRSVTVSHPRRRRLLLLTGRRRRRRPSPRQRPSAPRTTRPPLSCSRRSSWEAASCPPPSRSPTRRPHSRSSRSPHAATARSPRPLPSLSSSTDHPPPLPNNPPTSLWTTLRTAWARATLRAEH
jgi:hypothetical protein